MCLIALALDCHRRFPLVVAANRDEFFERPAARLAWWTPEAGVASALGVFGGSEASSSPLAVLSGRDLQGGGTWLGLTAEGRLAMLTNVRRPSTADADAPSRGRIVTDWLSGREPTDRFWMRTALSGHNGFNLVAADFRRGECFWASNVQPYPMRLERGLYGLSNAGLDTPWPKVLNLKARLRAALDEADALQATAANEAAESSHAVDALANRLFDALADRGEAPDAALPETGVPREIERRLSAAHIRPFGPRGPGASSYGTRCATLVITERVRRQLVTHVFERSFSPTGGLALLRRSTLKHWPPRYANDDVGTGSHAASTVGTQVTERGPVSDTELPPSPAEADAPPAKRTRVRSLLKPDAGRRKR